MRAVIFMFVLALGIGVHMPQAQAQTSTSGANVITTAVPFLTITPDSRAGGMGDAGVATSPDVNSQHWDPAKYAFVQGNSGIGLSYTPWLRNLVDGINLGYLAGYFHVDNTQTLSASLRYFDLGDVSVTDENGDYQGLANPNEWAIDFAYTRLLSEHFSGSVALRYIRSDLSGGQMVAGVETSAGNAVAADVAFYYRNEMHNNRLLSVFSAGIDISNIGTKISYTDGTTKDFIPTNLRLGVGYEKEADNENTFSFNLDLNKLLVPTPRKDLSTDEDGIYIGNDFSQDKSVVEGIFSSFSDASFKEEMQEIAIAVGGEYWYNKQFSLRTGYFYENKNKGNRKFFTVGLGARLKTIGLDFSYMIPTERDHPLSNTIRISVLFDLDRFTQGKQ